MDATTRPTPALDPAATPAEEVTFRSVLVPIDGSVLGELALGPALWLAGRFGAEVHAVAVAAPREQAWLDRYLSALQVRWPELPLHRAHDRGPGAAIRAVADDLGPTLVCMATHGWGRGDPIVGTAFADVASTLERPLVAVGPHGRAPLDGGDGPGRIVACLDGTPTGEAILPDATAWARRLDWRLTLVTVAEPAPTQLVAGVHRYRAFGPDDPDAYLVGVVDRHRFADIEVDTSVVWNPLSAKDGLHDHLAERPATLVAVATHARRGAARLLRGSRAAEVIRDCPVPVLVRPVPTTVHHLGTDAEADAER